MTTIEIVFDDSDLDDGDEEEEVLSDDGDGIPDESSDDDGVDVDEDESISFESDADVVDDEEVDEEEDTKDDEDLGEESGGIDLAEFYDETPKKSAKAIFNKRKRTNPPKVAKAKRIKKKKGADDIVIPNYLMEDVREKTIECLKKYTTEKNAKTVERCIYNHTVRKIALSLCRAVKKTDLGKDFFKKTYTMITIEIIFSIAKGAKCNDSISNLESNKTGLKSIGFRNEQFNDNQETDNIKNPPKVMRGIHTCSVCIKDPDRKNDPDRGKRVDWYQKQTRSCDEPSRNFCSCMDCGKKWSFC